MGVRKRASLHWLPVKYRIQFKILLVTNIALKGQAPPNLKELTCGSLNLHKQNGRQSLQLSGSSTVEPSSSLGPGGRHTLWV